MRYYARCARAQATDNVLKQTHLLSSQEGTNPYLSAMGTNLPEYAELCAEISTGSRPWSDVTTKGSTHEAVEAMTAGSRHGEQAADTSTPPLNPYDDPD
eukprot:COSAG02_NODE_1157_length_14186_cov_11.986299_4_plen_99_part_00